jgi:hypothetical protein
MAKHSNRPDLKLIQGEGKKRIPWFEILVFSLALAGFLKAFHIL